MSLTAELFRHLKVGPTNHGWSGGRFLNLGIVAIITFRGPGSYLVLTVGLSTAVSFFVSFSSSASPAGFGMLRYPARL
jgi:hypothetical protein